MSNSDEKENYVSPWVDEQPSDPKKAKEAADALGALYELYHSEGVERTREEAVNATRRMHHAIERYAQLSVSAAAEGLGEATKPAFIQKGLLTDGILSLTDPATARQEFDIISRGYELNIAIWEGYLGRGRRFRNDLRDMQQGK